MSKELRLATDLRIPVRGESLRGNLRRLIGHCSEDDITEVTNSELKHFGVSIGNFDEAPSNQLSSQNATPSSPMRLHIYGEELRGMPRVQLGHDESDDVREETSASLVHFGQEIGNFNTPGFLKTSKSKRSQNYESDEDISQCESVNDWQSDLSLTSEVREQEDSNLLKFLTNIDNLIQNEQEDHIKNIVKSIHEVLTDSEIKRNEKWFSKATQSEYMMLCLKSKSTREQHSKTNHKSTQESQHRLAELDMDQFNRYDIPLFSLGPLPNVHQTPFPHQDTYFALIHDTILSAIEAMIVEAMEIKHLTLLELVKMLHRLCKDFASALFLNEAVDILNAVQNQLLCVYREIPDLVSGVEFLHSYRVVESKMLLLESWLVETVCRFTASLENEPRSKLIQKAELDGIYERAKDIQLQVCKWDEWKAKVQFCLLDYDFRANGSWIPSARNVRRKPSVVALPTHSKNARLDFLQSLIAESKDEFQWLQQQALQLNLLLSQYRERAMFKLRSIATQVGKKLSCLEQSEANERRLEFGELRLQYDDSILNLLAEVSKSAPTDIGTSVPKDWLCSTLQDSVIDPLRRLQILVIQYTMRNVLGRRSPLPSELDNLQTRHDLLGMMNTHLQGNQKSFVKFVLVACPNWLEEYEKVQREKMKESNDDQVENDLEGNTDENKNSSQENEEELELLELGPQSLESKQILFIRLRALCWILQYTEEINQKHLKKLSEYQKHSQSAVGDDKASIDSMQLVAETQHVKHQQGLVDLTGILLLELEKDTDARVLHVLNSNLHVGTISELLQCLYSDAALVTQCLGSEIGTSPEDTRDRLNSWSQPRMENYFQSISNIGINDIQRRSRPIKAQIEALKTAARKQFANYQVRRELRERFHQRIEKAKNLIETINASRTVGPWPRDVAEAEQLLRNSDSLQESKERDDSIMQGIQNEIQTLEEDLELFSLKESRLRLVLASCAAAFEDQRNQHRFLLPPTASQLQQTESRCFSAMHFHMQVSPRSPRRVLDGALFAANQRISEIRLQAERSAGVRPSHLQRLQRAEQEFKVVTSTIGRIKKEQEESASTLQLARHDAKKVGHALGALEALCPGTGPANGAGPVEVRQNIRDRVLEIQRNVEDRRKQSVEIDLKEQQAQDNFMLSGGLRRYHRPWKEANRRPMSPIGSKESKHKPVVIPNGIGDGFFEPKAELEMKEQHCLETCDQETRQPWNPSTQFNRREKILKHTVHQKFDVYSHHPDVGKVNRRILQPPYAQLHITVNNLNCCN